MDIQDIIELYEEGKSLSFIANKYNTYGAKIKTILIKNNIPIRTRAEQNRITNQERGKKVNHQYFDNIDTFQKAWLLGFLAADGNVSKDRNRIKIGLSSIDREILEKIQLEIESERNILDYETNQGFQVSELSWSSENQKQKLAQYDIVPNKTYKGMNLPKFNNLEMQMAFILGYYDGDGCFKNDGTTCRFEICSYDKTILEDFSECIQNVFSIKKSVYQDKNRINYYTLTYSTKEAVQILDYMYKIMNNNNNFYLQRKYNKYKEWLIQNNRIK